MALLTDVLDHLEAKNGFRSDGFTMSVYGSIMVGLAGLGTGVVNGLLSAGGYDSTNVHMQPKSAQNMLVWLYLAIELICYALLVVIMLFTNVEKHIKEDHEIILEHQKQAVLANGGTWIEPSERLKMEQEESERLAEESRIAELKARCEAKGLSFEEEEQKYQDKLKEKQERKEKFLAKFKKKK